MSPTSFEVPRLLARRYEIFEQIGRGGMGSVYRALDPLLEREVAIKIVRSDNDAELQRFTREARLVASLDHPAIVPVFDFGVEGPLVFIVMPLLAGRTLRDLLASGPLPPATTAAVGRQVADALSSSHARGIIHRDIKPENIMVFFDEDRVPRVRVMDFGVAVVADPNVGALGTVAGTLEYLSPEQALGHLLDGRSDLHALGVVLYECCTGVGPFAGGSTAQILDKILHLEPPSVRAHAEGLDPALADLIARLLSKKAAARPGQAREVSEALQSIADRLAAPIVPPRAPATTTGILEAPPASAALIGRGAEVDRLSARIERAFAGECQFVSISGGPGIGKTALCDALEAIAGRVGARILRARGGGPAVDEGPLAPFGEIMVQLLRERPEPRAPELVGLVDTLRGRPPAQQRPSTHPIPPRLRRGDLFEALGTALALATEQRPTLLLIEDVHLAGAAIDALRYLFRRLAASPVLVVFTWRIGQVAGGPLPALRSDLLGNPRFGEIELGPLADEDHRALVQRLLPGAAEPLVAALHTATGGDPGLLHEAVLGLRAVGELAPEGSGWRLVRGPGPLTREDIVATRARQLEGLRPAARGLLEATVLLGGTCTPADARRLVADADDALHELHTAGLLRPTTRGSELASALVGALVDLALAPGRRRELHRQIAEALTEQGVGTSRLLHHWAHADRRDRALSCGIEVIDRALQASMPEEGLQALRLVQRTSAARLVDAVAEARLELLGAEAQFALGRGEDGLAEATAALERAEAAAPEEQVDLVLWATELAWHERELDHADAWSERGLSLAEASGRSDAVRRLRELRTSWGPGPHAAGSGDPELPVAQGAVATPEALGELLFIQGEYLAAQEVLTRAHHDERARGALVPAAEARHLLRMARLAHRLGRLREATELCERARPLVEAAAPLIALEADALAALVHCTAGRFGAARPLLAAALPAVADLPGSDERDHVEAQLHRSLGTLELGGGQPWDAVRAFQRSLALLDPATDPWLHSTALVHCGVALLQAGAVDDAVYALDTALADKLRLGDRWGTAQIHAALSGARLVRGQTDTALVAAQHAVELALAVGDPALTAKARVAQAEVLNAWDEFREATCVYHQAMRDAESCGAAPEIAAALLGLSAIQLARGWEVPARRAAQQARERAEGLGAPLLVCRSEMACARTLRTVDLRVAIEHADTAVALAASLGNPLLLLEAEATRAASTEELWVEDVFVEQLRRARELQLPALAGALQWRLARAAAHRGDPALAAERAEEALSLFSALGAQGRANTVRNWLTALRGEG